VGKQRSVHDPASLTIVINLDHTHVAAALGDWLIVRALFHWLGGERMKPKRRSRPQ
jgi:hypothetical protein